MLVITFLLAFPVYAQQPDGWLCREGGTVWRGDVIESCGVGENASEAQARLVALDNAYRELETVCSNSANCRGRELNTVPLRTECLRTKDRGFVCYRGVRAMIAGVRRSPTAARNEIRRQLDNLNQLHGITESVANSMAASFH